MTGASVPDQALVPAASSPQAVSTQGFDPSRKIMRTLVVDLTPQELAVLFTGMGSDDQARFFDEVAGITAAWGGLGWCGQCAYLADEITPRAREVVKTLAGHVLAEAGQ